VKPRLFFAYNVLFTYFGAISARSTAQHLTHVLSRLFVVYFESFPVVSC